MSHEYQIVLESDGGGERMVLHVETEPGSDRELASRIGRAVQDLLALRPDVRLCRPGELERPQGKSVRVIDRRSAR